MIKAETIYDGANGPYMFRIVIQRLRLHKFYRGDAYAHPHDHPFDFWTFPLVSYVEAVLDLRTGLENLRVVHRFRWHFRKAEFSHRVLGRWSGDDEYTGFETPQIEDGPIYTIVWTGKKSRKWGFWIGAQWIHFKKYLSGDRGGWVD